MERLFFMRYKYPAIFNKPSSNSVRRVEPDFSVQSDPGVVCAFVLKNLFEPIKHKITLNSVEGRFCFA